MQFSHVKDHLKDLRSNFGNTTFNSSEISVCLYFLVASFLVKIKVYLQFFSCPDASKIYRSVYSNPYKHFNFEHLAFRSLVTSVGIVSYKRLCFL